jgi:hypothetical protein
LYFTVDGRVFRCVPQQIANYLAHANVVRPDINYFV